MGEKLWQTNCGNCITKIGKKKLWQTNCGNAIVEIGGKNFITIVAMALLKMGKKKVVPKSGEE